MTTETTTHLHDLGITISIGDLEAVQLREMREILEAEMRALVYRVNAKTAALTGQSVTFWTSYDGASECGEHKGA